MERAISEFAPLVQALLGPAPRTGAVLRFAANHAPPSGVGLGTWSESVASSTDQLVDRLSHHAELGDVYIATAWFDPARPKLKTGVIAKTWAGVEVDAKSMPGSTDGERRGQARSLAGCLPCPSILIGSGGGYHVHVRLPAGWRVEDVDDPADGVARVELLGRALRLYLEEQARQIFGASVSLDHVHGAERVWRIPPAWNAKSADGARTLTADRTAWRSVTLESPGRTEGLSGIAPADLTFLAPFMNAAEDEANRGDSGPPVATLDSVSHGGLTTSETSVATFQGLQLAFSPSVLAAELQRGWPFDSPDQSNHDFRIAAALARDGWAPPVAAEAIRQRRALLRDPEDAAKGGRTEYVRRTVLEAYSRAAVATPPRDVAPFAPFPLELLCSPIREFVEAGRAAMTCAAEAIVLPLLAALGAAIGNTRRIQLKRTWSEPPLLWVCVVQGSGKTKSPAQELALRPHVVRQKRAFATYRAAMSKFLGEAAEHRREMKQWEKAGDGSPPTAPTRPVLFRVLVSEATIEAITPILEENPRGVLLSRDELSGWMKSFDAYRGGRGSDREHWLSAHRAHPIIVDRKTEREARFVEHGYIGVCGGTQPGILRTLCTTEAFQSGLVARLLLAWPDSPRKRWNDDDIPVAVQRAVEHVFERLFTLEMAPPAEAGLGLAGQPPTPREPGPVLVPLSDDARVLWRAFYDEFAAEQEGVADDEALAAAFAKLEAYAARFALILEHVGWAASSQKDPPSLIGADAMRDGIAMARWFAAEARRAYELLGQDGQTQRRKRLIEWIAAQGHPVTAHQLVRGPRTYRGNVETAASDLEDLVGRGLAWRAPVMPATGGHATTVYALRANLQGVERGDARSTEPSADKDLRSRVSPPTPDSDLPGATA